ncbi:MAG: hypothetical protein ORO03_08280 [Alphaproteobacteria bacterium]|nr:hypothetical protein [Alphaproteobacteria bacterium]
MINKKLQPTEKSSSLVSTEINNLFSNMLGELSAKYESGNLASGAISSGIGDRGGVSYGLYQMSSLPDGGTVRKFIAQLKPQWLAKLTANPIGSPEFNLAWQEIARKNDVGFSLAQHEFIRTTHYLPMVKALQTRCKLNLNNHSFSMQNVIWSCAVQHGSQSRIPSDCWKSLPTDIQQGDRLSCDTAWITTIYRERGRVDEWGNLVYFPHCSAEVQKSLKRRFKSESLTALKMIHDELTPSAPSLTMAKMAHPSKG